MLVYISGEHDLGPVLKSFQIYLEPFTKIYKGVCLTIHVCIATDSLRVPSSLPLPHLCAVEQGELLGNSVVLLLLEKLKVGSLLLFRHCDGIKSRE